MEAEEHVRHHPEVEILLAKMNLDVSTLECIMVKMGEMMERGLLGDPKQPSSLKMLPSYVCSLPDGTESGDHLALDLGGTNFRVLVIKLHPNRKADQENKIYAVPPELMTGTGDKLFDHIATCLDDFVKQHKMEGRKIPLGFTFSFPCQQEGLTEARLITWTKGYKTSGVEGEDVAKLLHEAIQRRTGGDVDVVAVLNDTVGTLMALAHEDAECMIGVILGTGTNACYMEQATRCPKLKSYFKSTGYDQMIINMEWGAFGDLGELEACRTEFDVQVDENSINPGRQTFEKMISGMYMGELVRLILIKLTQMGHTFGGKTWDELTTRDRFHGQYVTEITKSVTAEKCTGNCFSVTQGILREFGVKEPTPTDCANVAYVCLTVVKRSADLCAAGIAALLNRLDKPKVTVGIDGSVYRYNQPHFRQFLTDRVQSLLRIRCDFTMKLSTDGSGRGAALVAAVAARLMNESKGV